MSTPPKITVKNLLAFPLLAFLMYYLGGSCFIPFFILAIVGFALQLVEKSKIKWISKNERKITKILSFILGPLVLYFFWGFAYNLFLFAIFYSIIFLIEYNFSRKSNEKKRIWRPYDGVRTGLFGRSVLVVFIQTILIWSYLLSFWEISPYKECLERSTLLECANTVEHREDIKQLLRQETKQQSIDLQTLSQLEGFYYAPQTEQLVFISQMTQEKNYSLPHIQILSDYFPGINQPIPFLKNWNIPFCDPKVDFKPLTHLAYVGTYQDGRYLRIKGDIFVLDPKYQYEVIGVTYTQYLALPSKEITVISLFKIILLVSFITIVPVSIVYQILKKGSYHTHKIFLQEGYLSNTTYILRDMLSSFTSALPGIIFYCCLIYLVGHFLYWIDQPTWGNIFFVLFRQGLTFSIVILFIYILCHPLLDFIIINHTPEFTLKGIFRRFTHLYLDLATKNFGDINSHDIRLLRTIEKDPTEGVLFSQGFRKYRTVENLFETLGGSKYTQALSDSKLESLEDCFWPWISAPHLEKYPKWEQKKIESIIIENKDLLRQICKLKDANLITIDAKFQLTDYGESLLLYPDRFFMEDIPSWLHRRLCSIHDSLSSEETNAEPFEKLNRLLEELLKHTFVHLSPFSFHDPWWKSCYWVWTSERQKGSFRVVAVSPSKNLVMHLRDFINNEQLQCHEDSFHDFCELVYSGVVLAIAYPQDKIQKKINRLQKKSRNLLTKGSEQQNLIQEVLSSLTHEHKHELFQCWLRSWKEQFIQEETVGVLLARIVYVLEEVQIKSKCTNLMHASIQQKEIMLASRDLRNQYSHDKDSQKTNDTLQRVHDMFQYYSLMKALVYSSTKMLSTVRELRF